MDPQQVGQLKVAELKDELKKRGLPLKGLKAELAERLLEAVRNEAAQHDEAPKDAVDEAEVSLQEEKSGGVDDAGKPELDPVKDVAPVSLADQVDSAEANVEEAGTDGETRVETKDVAADEATDAQVQEREPAEAGSGLEELAPVKALAADPQEDALAPPVEDGQGDGSESRKEQLPAESRPSVVEGGGGPAPETSPVEPAPKQEAAHVEPDALVVDMETEDKAEPEGASEQEDATRKGGKETVTDIRMSDEGPESVELDKKGGEVKGDEGKKAKPKEIPKQQGKTPEIKETDGRKRESGSKRAKEADASTQNGGETGGRPAKLLKAEASHGERTHVPRPSGRKLSERSDADAQEKPAKPVESEKSSKPGDRVVTSPSVRSAEKSNGGVERKREVPASARPATRSVRVNNLVRPFTERALRALLTETGTIEENGFWMDSIKTHCYVTFKSIDDASRTREALFNSRWPPQNPKTLSVSFVPESEVEAKVKGALVPPSPTAVPATSRGATREAAAVPVVSPTNQRVVLPVKERLTIPAAEKSTPAAAEPPPLFLDDLFRKTTSKPCIYWLPLTDEQVKQRTVEAGSAPPEKAEA